MYICTLQDALFIGYKQSLDNARSIVFQRTGSTLLIEGETFNVSNIIKNLIDYEDGQEPDILECIKYMRNKPNKYMCNISNKLGKHFRKKDTNSERNLKFQKELRSRISGYGDVHKQLTNRPSSQTLITYFTVPKNKSIETVSSSDDSDFEIIHHRKMLAMDYDE
ncbi:uncharacterized protein TNCV_145351 [Trichonephila clavipes]|nr:uncharacterized protein TNCV_145351 [Trichonephila clavipes]